MGKIDVQSIVVDGKTYVPKDSVVEVSGDIKIVILQRGWCMVGILERDGDKCKLHNSSVIRRWGTSKGLGQLAHEGPQPETKLDKNYGVVEFDSLTVVATIDCRGAAWENKL